MGNTHSIIKYNEYANMFASQSVQIQSIHHIYAVSRHVRNANLEMLITIIQCINSVTAFH